MATDFRESHALQRKLRYEPCEQEHIRTCGHVQGHGILIGVTPRDFKILYLSAHIEPICEESVQDLLGEHLNKLILQSHSLERLLKIEPNTSCYLPNFINGKGGIPFDVYAHHSEKDLLLLECFGPSAARNIPEIFWTSIFEMSEEEVYDCLFSHLDHILEYHRALIYKFQPDGSGLVTKEHIQSTSSAETVRYLGLRYPATDIPKIVRDLYLENPIRYIANINEASLPIVGLCSESKPSSLDLTKLLTRAVSPFHANYLRNMGVTGACSCAIVIQGKLWGLLSIHQKKPQLITYKALCAIQSLAKTLSEFLRSKSISDQMQFFDHENMNTKAWINLLLGQSPPRSLFFGSTLAKFFGAQGFAFFNGETWIHEGDVPDRGALMSLATTVASGKHWGIFQTDCLYAEHPAIAKMMPDSCGVTIGWCHNRISKDPYFLIWLKKEFKTMVKWGSYTEFPDVKSMPEGDFSAASPRTSFGLWQESITLHSETWSKESQYVARNLLNLLMACP